MTCILDVNDNILGLIITIVSALSGFTGAKLHSYLKKPSSLPTK